MEQFQFLRDRAFEKVKIADHMLFMTYPVVKDPKLLVAILENVSAGLDYGVASLLHHQLLFKQIPPFKESFQSRFDMFKSQVVPKLNLSQNYVKLISDVRQLLSAHKRSPVSFAKQDKFVILSPKYDVKSLDVNLMKRYVFETKLFVSNVNAIVSKNERIFI
jgi:hypothetical protein